MTTYRIDVSYPTAGGNSVGMSAPTPSGLTLDDSVTGSGNTKSLLDNITGSTNAIKVGKLLHAMNRVLKNGAVFMATADSGATYIKPTQ